MMKVLVVFVLVVALQGLSNADDGIEEFDMDMKYRVGYNPFKLFGDQPVPIKRKGQRAPPIPTDCFCGENQYLQTIFYKIRAGSILRFNLIKVFGYILHRPNLELNTAYYTSLYFILTSIKVNHADIYSLVIDLAKIEFQSPNEQFLKLFALMETSLPSYLGCAARFWRKGIESKTIDLNRILAPYGEDTVVMSVLDGLSPKDFQTLAKAEKAKPPTTRRDQQIVFDFNVNVLQLVQDFEHSKTIVPRKWLVAGMLQFFPRTLIQPDQEESIQVLSQYLYEQNLTQITVPKEKSSPIDFMTYVLERLIKEKKSPDVIKDAAQTIRRSLKHRSPTAVNPDYSSFTYYVQPNAYQSSDMLRFVSKGAFPLDVISAAERVRWYISEGKIPYQSVTVTFNPYLYSSSTEVLMAILDRIMRRNPDLPTEILNSVGAVYSHLIFKFRYSKLPLSYSSDMVNMNVLFMGLRSPDVRKDIREKLDVLISVLQKEPIVYANVLREKVPIYKCTTPVICLVWLLKTLQDTPKLADQLLNATMVDLLNNEDCCSGNCPLTLEYPGGLFPETLWRMVMGGNSLEAPTTTHPTKETMTTITVPTQKTTMRTELPPTTPVERRNRTATTMASTAATTPTPPYSTTTVVSTKKPGDASVTLIEIVSQIGGSANDSQIERYKRMVAILKDEKISEWNEKHNENMYASIIALYVNQYLPTLGLADTDEEFKSFVANWKEDYPQYLQSATVLDQQELMPDTAMLAISLPTPANKSEEDLLEVLKQVLARHELYEFIRGKIQNKEKSTVGVFLKAILREEAKLKDKLSAEELKAVNYFIGRVQLSGFGEHTVEYEYKLEVQSVQVDVSQVLDNAIEFNSLDNGEKTMFNSIIAHLGKEQSVFRNWSNWQRHFMSGDFTAALFKQLLDTPSTPLEVREAVQKLTPKINFDKSGTKAAFKKPDTS